MEQKYDKFNYINKSTFELDLTRGFIPNDAIVFIQETNLIWTHGNFYPDIQNIKDKIDPWHLIDDNGFYITDNNGNIGLEYVDETGLDFAHISNHAVELIKDKLGVVETDDTQIKLYIDDKIEIVENTINNISGVIDSYKTNLDIINDNIDTLKDKLSVIQSIDENGLYIADSNGNIGLEYVEETGLDFAHISDHAVELIKDKIGTLPSNDYDDTEIKSRLEELESNNFTYTLDTNKKYEI